MELCLGVPDNSPREEPVVSLAGTQLKSISASKMVCIEQGCGH